MKHLEREQANIVWAQYAGEMQTEWFKVEVLQDYSGEDAGESLKAWMAGGKERAIQILREEGKDYDWAKQFNASPAEKIRIHIVEEPYSDYLLWEIEHYKAVNIPFAGEKVYLLPKEEVQDLNLPDGDIMIFDRKRVAKCYYNSENRMIAQDFYDESDDISKFLELREELLNRVQSKPFLV